MATETPHPWENPNRPPPKTPRNLAVAYLLWLPLGLIVGAHHVYLGDHRKGGIWLGLIVLGFIVNKVSEPDLPFGSILIGAVWIWWLVDAFLLPGRVRRFNEALAQQAKAA
jgi:TM2 domain-containing membrane protein YozV